MTEVLNMSKEDENRNAMLGYLTSRGQILEQIQTFDKLWNELLEQPLEQSWLRLLRINLRKLRSAIKVLEPLLPSEGKVWIEFLKKTADTLGEIREYDVALKECDKYAVDQLEAEVVNPYVCQELPALKALLMAKRQEKTEAWLETAEPGCIANTLQPFLELLGNAKELSLEEEALANAFLQARLQSWGIKLCNKLKNEAGLESVEKLHSIRIKIKRFRYAYGVYMNREVDEELLECLKNAQDIMGSIHDGDCDLAIMESIVREVPEEQLSKEFADFKKWRLEKTKLRLDSLPRVCAELVSALQNNIEGARLL